MENLNEALREAAKSGNDTQLEALLLNVECSALNKGLGGIDALMCAAYSGHTSCLKRLLPVSNPLAKDDDGWTALMWATRNGKPSCVEMLLAVSEVSAVDRWNINALMWAARIESDACLKLLIPLSDVCFLADHGGLTALMWAASSGYTKGVQCLLPVSDPLVKNSRGETASDVATEKGHLQLARLIDAYVLAMRELKVFDSSISRGVATKRASLRV